MPTETELAGTRVQPNTSTAALDAELQNLTEPQLKAAIQSAWKKHEQLAKAELAPLLYWLRERLRAQGARNDIADKDRGFGAWVEEYLDFTRRTADRWCDWYAKEAGLVPIEPTSGQVSKSDVDQWEEIVDQHKSQKQIAFNVWIDTAVHTRYQKALTTIQKKFGLKDSKEAVVKGVIYAAKVIANTSATGSGRERISTRRAGRLASNRNRRRASMGTTAIAQRKDEKRIGNRAVGVPNPSSNNGHRGNGSSTAMRADAGR
jgi:hypothetical protein